MRGVGKCCPGAESDESWYLPAINRKRDIFAGETEFVGVFLFVELPFKPVRLINPCGVYDGAGGIKSCYN